MTPAIYLDELRGAVSAGEDLFTYDFCRIEQGKLVLCTMADGPVGMLVKNVKAGDNAAPSVQVYGVLAPPPMVH